MKEPVHEKKPKSLQLVLGLYENVPTYNAARFLAENFGPWPAAYFGIEKLRSTEAVVGWQCWS